MTSKKKQKFIFVTGGVMSGVGKGIAASSIGLILQSKGFKVNPIKVDPYLNVDAGTMNPTEHGEVFVLDSGLETDQDMGNYERFMEVNLSNDDYMTSGMIYKHVIDKERNLGYKGKCVEAIPHITEEITNRILRSAKTHDSDITLVEIGGTVGDYQNALFIEAARVLKIRHPDDVMFIMVSYLPIPGSLGEMKTRPTQNAVRQLNSYGVQPDMIIARSKLPLDEKRKEKIAFACAIRTSHVISAPDISSVYDVPVNFEKDNIGNTILKSLHLRPRPSAEDLRGWNTFVKKMKTVEKEVKIAIVGKYFDTGDFVLSDAYLSVIEALKYSAYHSGAKPVLTWLNAKDFEKGKAKVSSLKDYDGIIVPGGFGESGIEGKLKVIQYAREKKIPYFGLCYGMQLLVIEYARNVLGLKDANTGEITPDGANKVVDIMPAQKKLLEEGKYGASMRLGAYPAVLGKGTVAREAYGADEISERHRHRYEVNQDYVEKLKEAGLVFSGTSPDGKLMEIAELPEKEHPFFLGTQFHPEFKARPVNPHPLFTAFIKAAIKASKKS
ncbi:MAG: CTP synthase [Candidatus Paceibacterota bacterium]|jgi:CTP synthase